MTALFTLGSIKAMFSAWCFVRSYKRYNDLDNADNVAVVNTCAVLHMGYLVMGVLSLYSAISDFVQNFAL